jgi:hypothetical protein
MKTKNKYSFVFLLLLVVSSVLMIDFVSAQDIVGFMGSVGSSLVRIVQEILRPILSSIIGDTAGGDILFAKILLLILLFTVINAVTHKIPAFRDKRGTSLVIAIVVSVLAVRFMSQSQLINGILLPYGVLGVALTTILPFFIFFYFIHNAGMVGFTRRISWVVFGIVFLVLWFNRMNTLSSESNTIYGFTVFAIFLAFIFDKSLQRYFGTHELAVWKRGANQKVIAGLQSEYLQILHVDSPTASARRRAIESHIKRLGGNMEDLGI